MFDKIIRVLGPLFVFFISIILKILLLDFGKIPKTDHEKQMVFMISEYVKPMWFDLLLSSFFLLIGLSLRDSTIGITPDFKKKLFVALGVVAFICLLFNMFDRLQLVTNRYLVIGVPDILGISLFGISSWATTKDT